MSNRLIHVLMLASCLALAGSLQAGENDDPLGPTEAAVSALTAEGADAGQTEAEESRIAEPGSPQQAEAPTTAAEKRVPATQDTEPTEIFDLPPRTINEQLELRPRNQFRGAPGWHRELLPEGSYPPPTFFSPDMKRPPRSWRVVGPGLSPHEYYLGISLKSVDDTLRSHLRLGAKVGIVVDQVAPDSPAEMAGLMSHDVLTHADEQPITRYQDLITAVQQAGAERRELTLALIRAGEPGTAIVTPSKHAEGNRAFRWQPDGRALVPRVPDIVVPPPEVPRGIQVVPAPRELLDGWMRDQARDQDELKQQIEQLRRDVDQLRKMLEERHPPE